MDRTPNDYALLVGVERYPRFGGADVPGALGDARAWIRQCLAMGFSPSRIRVLTSPPLTAADVGPEADGVSFGEATRDAIVEGLAWIYGALAGDAPAAGLATFSGHGLFDPELVLCPTDFDGSAASAVAVSRVRAEVAGSDTAAARLTVVLDCCHAQGNANATGIGARLAEIARSRHPGGGHPGGGHPGGGHAERLLAACATDQVSLSSRFGGVRMGAFTWAVTSVLGQWRTETRDGVAWLDLAYGELRDRAARLLTALSFAQTPVLSGPIGLGGHPFLHPGRPGGVEATSPEPTANRAERQIGPGLYTITVNDALLGYVYATGSCTGVTVNGYPLQPNMEYWYLSAAAVKGLGNAPLVFTHAPIASQNYVPQGIQGDVAPAIFYETAGPDGTSVWAPATGPVSAAGVTSRFFVQGGAWLQLLSDAQTGQIAGIYWYQQGTTPIVPVGTYSPSPVGPPFGTSTGWCASTGASSLARYALRLTDTTHGQWFVAVGDVGTLWASTVRRTTWLLDPHTARVVLPARPERVMTSDGVAGHQLKLAPYGAGTPGQAWAWDTTQSAHLLLQGTTMGAGAMVGSPGQDVPLELEHVQGVPQGIVLWTLVKQP